MAVDIGLDEGTLEAIPIDFVDAGDWEGYAAGLPERTRAFARACGFEAKPGQSLLEPGENGALERVLFGVEAHGARRRDPFLAGKLATLLPPGVYRFDRAPADPEAAALAFLLSRYRFSRYVAPKAERARLCEPAGVDAARLARIVRAVVMGRDLVNTPANDMGPEALSGTALELAERHGAMARVVVGGALLTENFPLIHAVGRASAQAPRLVDFVHGPEDALKVTLVGKGVCFDTGGLDIKPSSGMLMMKKDMGGAAVALSLASMLLEGEVPVRLRVILPIVENSLSASAYRPGDVYRSRKGLSVEIGNTDAEGRLVLADALWYVRERIKPRFIVDLATLTGAIMVALGQERAGLFSNDDELAARLSAAGAATGEMVWRMPLGPAYDKLIDSKIADMKNTGGRNAGAITAAQFLKRFVDDTPWAHLDVAGAAMNSPANEINQSWGSGWGVRLLDRLIAEHYES